MDERACFERLDSTASDPAGLFEHFEQRTVGGETVSVLPDSRHGVERGTVILGDDAIVRGYPSIPRVLALDAGVTSFFETDETVVAEEKLDGFNVRVAAVGDSDGPLAFTRGGYVCPYTTAKTRELLDLDPFFEKHAEKMLCAELIGPETPYSTHDYDGVDSYAIRVFDVRDREFFLTIVSLLGTVLFHARPADDALGHRRICDGQRGKDWGRRIFGKTDLNTTIHLFTKCLGIFDK